MNHNPFPIAGKLLVLLFTFFVNVAVQAQCLIPSSQGDSTFPVTNRYNIRYNSVYEVADEWGSGVFKVALDKGRYFLHGFFSNLVKNQGPALVIDSATNTVRTPQKWRVNGTVMASIPDGRGGFFIAGDFTKIGDSSRRYLARINTNGEPSAWNPRADAVVRALQIRNDTLYIGGDFASIFSRPRSCFAMYSIAGDSILHSAVTGHVYIAAFLLNRDTLILGGDSHSGQSIRKYNIKNGTMMPWKLTEIEYGEINHMQFNEDSGVVAYSFYYGGFGVKGFNTISGVQVYKMEMAQFTPGSYGSGKVLAMKRMGNKIYATGYFEKIKLNSTVYSRFGFFSFNASTGAISSDDLKANGLCTFVEAVDGKLFLSGNFSMIDTIARLNFAVVDTGTLSLRSWQINPSDPITTMAFSNGKVFIGGHFNGIDAVSRRGYAAIDSATGNILPWNPSPVPYKVGDLDMPDEGKRMFVKGDTLFVLDIAHRSNSHCTPYFYSATLRMYQLSDGWPVSAAGMFYSKIYDIIVEGDYAYASVDGRLRRYLLPLFIEDAGWGYNYANDNNGFIPTYLIVRGDKLYAVGDNRFDGLCSPDYLSGFVYIHNLSDGRPATHFNFAGADPRYDHISFEHALLVGDKMYIEGEFDMLNGKQRHDFVCIDINTGSITDWRTPFSETAVNEYFHRSTDLKLKNGLIWFGTNSFYDTLTKKGFYGFGALDTASGVLMPAPFRLYENNMIHDAHGKSESFHDFVFTNEGLIGVGEFGKVDEAWHSNFVNLSLKPGAPPPVHTVGITGPDTVYSNNYPQPFSIAPSDNMYSYRWKYTGSDVSFLNNGNDTASVVANINATNGTLIVMATNYCGEQEVARKNIIIADPPPLPLPAIAGLSDRCILDFDYYAKLTNFPPYASVTILRNGYPIAYNASDSSFNYFTYSLTPVGTHTIRVKYKYTHKTVDSSEQEFTFTVNASTAPTVSITGNTTVTAGSAASISSAITQGGAGPVYKWQDSTQMHGWQDIQGATSASILYTAAVTGDRLRCILTSNAYCVWPDMVISNHLSFVVNTPTGIDPVERLSNSIELYPNPAAAVIVIDSLKLSDNWRTLEIMDLAGQRQLVSYSIQNKTRVSIPVSRLSNGYYVVVLRKKDGTVARKPFVKQ